MDDALGVMVSSDQKRYMFGGTAIAVFYGICILAKFGAFLVD